MDGLTDDQLKALLPPSDLAAVMVKLKQERKRLLQEYRKKLMPKNS